MNATESPPGTEKEKSASDKADSKFADNDTDSKNYTEPNEEVNGSRELPAILTMRQSYANPAPTRPEIIKGILRQECKMTLGGKSKARKTWQLINLALCLVTGEVWLGQFECNRTKVLYINFELHRDTFDKRVRAIAEAMELGPERYVDNLSQWGLRGYAAGADVLMPEIIERIKTEGFGVVIFDPLSKALGESDENSSRDMNKLLNEFEQVCRQTGCAMIIAQHYGKGNKAGVETGDRGRGSSAVIGDIDVSMEFVEHKDSDKTKDTLVVETIVREFPPVEPFTVRWDGYTLFEPIDLDPSRLKVKKSGPAKADHSEFLLDVLADNEWTKSEWLQQSQVEARNNKQAVISKSSFYRELPIMLERKMFTYHSERATCTKYEGLRNA
jgi:AAA domain